MKHRKKLSALILSLLLLLSVTACGNATPAAQSGDGDSGGAETVYRTLEEIQAAGSVNIGVFSDKNPFGYVDENGDYQGYDIYFAERIGQDLGVTVNYVSTEAANRVEYLETGKADIILANFTVTAELLEIVRPVLSDKGIDLDIVIYDDYVLPNTALQDGELDANYFQHTPYLLSFNAANGTDLVSAGRIHYEPFGIYSYSVAALQDLAEGAVVIVPDDDSNQTRALLLLSQEGLIDLPDGASVENGVSVLDIADAHGYDIRAVQADAVPSLLRNSDDGTIAVINYNYALGAGFKTTDALAIEDASGDAAQTYANIIAVRRGDENRPQIQALVEALRNGAVETYNEQTGAGIVPVQ